jgi:hypothetical protein
MPYLLEIVIHCLQNVYVYIIIMDKNNSENNWKL